MKDIKHTPGPWRMSEFPDIDGYKIYGGRTAFNSKPRLLAVVKNQGTATMDESQNNARLFFYAPDLLAACKKYIDNRDDGRLGEENDLIEEAIARAEGSRDE